MAENEINKVHVLIRRFLYEIDDVIKDKDASHKWLVSFAKTLQFQDLCKEPNEYALFLLREAKEFNSIKKRASQIKQVRKVLAEEGIKEPTEEQIEQRWAKLYGDAATREGADESTTVSTDMPRVGQNGAHPRNQGGGRAVQGAMSHAPSVPAQDGKFRGSAKNQGDSNTGSTVPAVRPESGNLDARQSRRTAGDSFGLNDRMADGSHKASAPAVRVAEPEVMNLAYSGEFANVMLTQEQYVALLQKFGNKVACDRAIDSLSAKMENGEEKSRNHYATLVKWANYRADKADVTDNGAQPHYETVSEHNRRVLENGRKWIDEHFPKNEAANG